MTPEFTTLCFHWRVGSLTVISCYFRCFDLARLRVLGSCLPFVSWIDFVESKTESVISFLVLLMEHHGTFWTCMVDPTRSFFLCGTRSASLELHVLCSLLHLFSVWTICQFSWLQWSFATCLFFSLWNTILKFRLFVFLLLHPSVVALEHQTGLQGSNPHVHLLVVKSMLRARTYVLFLSKASSSNVPF